MRNFLKSLILSLSLVLMVSLVACGGDSASTSSSNSSNSGNPVQYSIIFKQAGQEDIIRYVNKGESLSDIPVCAEKRGYTVAWDRTDFSNIEENIIVNAVEDANEYKIYYQGIIQDYIPSNVALEYDESKGMYYAVVEYDKLHSKETKGYVYMV